MYKCKVCNKEFELRRKDHYIARDNGKTGLSSLVGGSEEELYDTFDCPHCGCQNVMQKRKRNYINIEVAEKECVTASDFEEVEENDDATVAVEKVYAGMHAVEHSKCFGQHDESDITCLSCDEKKECLVETEHSQNTNDGNVDVATDEDEDDWIV